MDNSQQSRYRYHTPVYSTEMYTVRQGGQVEKHYCRVAVSTLLFCSLRLPGVRVRGLGLGLGPGRGRNNLFMS